MHKYKVRFIGPTTIVHSPQRPTTKPRHAKIFNYHNKYLRFIEFVIRRSGKRKHNARRMEAQCEPGEFIISRSLVDAGVTAGSDASAGVHAILGCV